MTHDVSHWIALEMRFSATVHVQYHVICASGVKNNYIFGIPDPYLPIHYATFTGTIKGPLQYSFTIRRFSALLLGL